MLALQNELSLLVMMTHVVVVLILSALVYRSSVGWVRYSGFLILTTWFSAVCILAWSSVFADVESLLSPSAIALTLPVMVVALLLRQEGWLRRIVRSLSLRWLIGIQVYRVLGAIFFLGWLHQELPAELSIPTFIIDLAIGLTAILVAFIAQRRQHHGLVIAWNVVGLLDFVYSVSLTLLALPALLIIQMSPSPVLIGQLPLSLITAWAVPLSIALHLFVLFKIRQPTAESSQSVTTQPLKSAS